ncbi:cytochrome c [uncultured Desulfuromusa sp.]|uniref:c-type cytochrome n=1 Tax=uncultured Desulfuromusa sp. TaxID=219183 RepID=UPI002AA62C9C|nr:cytochrome c [uncultured Desulfuromusa sp.]
MNWKAFLMIGLILTAFTATSALAVEGGNARKGKHLFKKSCKSCHGSGGEGGELTPMSKTMSQWDRFFKKKTEDHPGDVFKTISDKDKKDINQFLHDSAADSPAPATCG